MSCLQIMGVKYQHRCPLVDTVLTATRIEVSQYKDTIYLNRFVLSSIYQALHNTRRDASATTRSSHQLQLALNSSVLHAMLQYRRSKQHNSKMACSTVANPYGRRLESLAFKETSKTYQMSMNLFVVLQLYNSYH